MLLLARVDGKSPVEYLTPAKRIHPRPLCTNHLPSPPGLASLCDRWFRRVFSTPNRMVPRMKIASILPGRF